MHKNANQWFDDQGLRPSRRDLLRSFVGVGAGAFANGLFAAPASARDLSGVRLVQLVDQGSDQQEVTRDYTNGVRLALTRSPSVPMPPTLLAFPCDGTLASARLAVQKIRADSSAVALLGAVGERTALSSIGALQQEGWSMAHVAPWLADSRFDDRPDVFAVFASREAQIRRALTNFAAVGVRDLGVVFTDVAQQSSLAPGLMTMLAHLGLQAKAFVPASQQDMAGYGQSFPGSSPAFLLFLGGAPELVAFGQAPSPMGLAGYLAGRYALAILSNMKGPMTRETVLAEFRTRRVLNLDGYRLDFLSNGRGSEYVDVGVLKAGGKLVG